MVPYTHVLSTMLSRLTTLLIVALCVALPHGALAQDIQADTLVQDPRIAPGEGLPVRTKLINTQSVRRVDVVLVYRIVDGADKTIDEETETVAIDTTATVFHVFTLPLSLPSGRYQLEVEALYPGQEFPAYSSFGFLVEPKLFGMFRSDLALFSALAAALFGAAILGFALLQRRRYHSMIPRDFSHIPERDRVYYEIVSDVLQQMRFAIGAKVVRIASKVEGIELDGKGGVARLTREPASVVADLVTTYERATAKKLGFAFGSTRRRRTLLR